MAVWWRWNDVPGNTEKRLALRQCCCIGMFWCWRAELMGEALPSPPIFMYR
jgi:hypothetical protein